MSTRLVATEANDGEEFVDFDGASLGLFRMTADPNRALIHAFHVVGKDSGYWISSGVELPLDSMGRLTEWVSCGIVHDWSSGTWELRIGDKTVLRGLRRAPDIEPNQFELWLFGQAAGENDFDDVRVAPFLPDDLLGAAATVPTVQEQFSAAPAGPRVVGPAQDVAHRRQANRALAHPVQAGAVLALEVKLEVVGGGRHIAAVDVTSDQGKPSQVFLYSPGYDEAGKPLPLQVKIDCDTKLREGTVLDDLRWAIVADEGEDNAASKIVRAHGSFATGPSQIATVPAEFSNKALHVHVGLFELDRGPDRRPQIPDR